jgi:O-methyltransferase involved in polyketide biosynthesis
MSGSASISPTAHYTGYVWARNNLSHPELQTLEGRVYFESLRPVMTASQLLGGSSLESYLLTRHRAIDALLERAIIDRGVSQVVEVAAGLSPRGWRFVKRFPELTYVETDLPGMVARKREALERMGSLSDRHRVEELDALSGDDVDELAASLHPERGVALVTEGLLGYLPTDAVLGMWRRFASALQGFPAGVYLSDLHIGNVQNAQIRAFRVLLSAFVRGRVHLHFDDPAEARGALLDAGFARAEVHRTMNLVDDADGGGSGLAHVIEAMAR